MVQWKAVFDELHPVTGATQDELDAFVASVSVPLTAGEIDEVHANQSNPFSPSDPLFSSWRPIDARRWRLPDYSLPPSYLEFLRFSNGGSFRIGDRWFDPFFTTMELRRYMLAYQVPEYLPGVIPFAFDGGGTFYAFDMRSPPVDGEFPVLMAHAGALFFDDCRAAGASFLEACSRRDLEP